MGAEVVKFLLSVAAGIVSFFVTLPIASDGIRGKLFNRKQKALVSAEEELFETIEGMILSGQKVGDYTYAKIAESIAQKYKISAGMLGDKDVQIAKLLQAISCTKELPSNIKRAYFAQLQANFSIQSNVDMECGADSPNVNYRSEISGSSIANIIDEWRSDNEDANQPIYQVEKPLRVSLILLIGCAVAFLVGSIVYWVDGYIFLLTLICLAAFLICVNVLISLIGNKEPKDIEFFRHLVYKIMSLLALTVFMIAMIFSVLW